MTLQTRLPSLVAGRILLDEHGSRPGQGNEVGQTERALSQMTDAGRFERLATALLREAEPLYANLCHPGVNAEGKTVRSPVDGLCYVPQAEPPLLVAVHHTTCAPRELRGKWLGGGPGAVRRRGAAAAVDEPDLPKAVGLIARERERTLGLCARVVLTTNQEPTEDLVRDVHATARAAGVEADLWPRSRIAHFLDQDPEGQWLRYRHLGITQERLSPTLLRELSASSLAALPEFESAEAWVERELDGEVARAARDRDVTFLIAPSGLGKTTACRKLLARHLAAGGCGLVLPHSIVETCASVDLAIEEVLRSLNPSLAAGCGSLATSMCDKTAPLLLVVEDVNRSGSRELLLERLAGWSAERTPELKWDSGARGADWRLLCPVWPETVALLREAPRRVVEALSIAGGALTPFEASAAVQRRADLASAPVSLLEAGSLADALGNDPLLIALHDGGAVSDAWAVIGTFISGCTRRLAVSGGATATEIRTALLALGEAMLAHRRMDPTWRDVQAWLGDRPEVLAAMRLVSQRSEVLRLVDDGQEERLVFRHDRVREHLLVEAVAKLMRNRALPPDILSDPFHAAVLGYALAEADLPSHWADEVASANILAHFFALQRFREPSAAVHHATVAAIEAWLNQGGPGERCNRTLGWAALVVLARTTSPLVVGVVRRLGGANSWAAIEAMLRNGDIAAALQVCLQVEPGIRSEWRDRMLAHARSSFGDKLVVYVAELLKRSDLEDGLRLAALRLAGHLGCGTLAQSVVLSWQVDLGRADRLTAYLWAGARCCGDDPDRLLGPVCDAWAALPGSSESSGSSPQAKLAASDVSWAFRNALPVPALRYFVRRAASDDLRWQIAYMLRGVDLPDAVEFIAHEMAAADGRSTQPGGAWHFASTFIDEWNERRGQRRSMSHPARSCLRTLWNDETASANLRKRAFGLWVTTHDHADVAVLRVMLADPVLGDRALVGLLERGERDAVPLLAERLDAGDDRGYWWQFARYVFGIDFLPILNRELSRRREKVGPGWHVGFGTDWIVAELLTRLPSGPAEQLLVEHWDHAGRCADFVQVALYFATPRLAGLVREAVSACPNPTVLFKHIRMHFGVHVTGRPGVVAIQQLQGLLPYLHLLDPFTTYEFWDLCNERRWYTFRRDHLDPALTPEWRSKALLDETDILAELDDMAARTRPLWPDHWIKRFLVVHETRKYLMDVLEQWLVARSSLEAFRVAAAMIGEVGSRADLDVLRHSAARHIGDADAVLADTAYRVRRRTLV